MFKAALEAWINRRWYGRPGLLWLLWPLSRLYRAVVKRKFLAHFMAPNESALPTVVVGNITVGGTGKTPMVLALVKHLQQRGLRPAIVTRGYGSSLTEFPHLVDLQNTGAEMAALIGDEPLLLAQRSAVPLVISPQRAEAVSLLAKMAVDGEPAIDVIVSDDGLQHYAMGRDIELAVVDAARGMGNGHCLPIGPLREPVSRLQSVDWIVQNGDVACSSAEALFKAHVAHAVPLTLKPQGFYRLVDDAPVDTQDIVEAQRKQQLHAVAAIGNPQRFFDTLAGLGISAESHAFADHHAYALADFSSMSAVPGAHSLAEEAGVPEAAGGCDGAGFVKSQGADPIVLMTEKDAVKCRAFASPHWYYLRVEAQLPPSFYSRFDEQLNKVLETKA